MKQTKAQLQAALDQLTKEHAELKDYVELIQTRKIHTFLETHHGFMYLAYDLDEKTTSGAYLSHILLSWLFAALSNPKPDPDFRNTMLAELDKLIAHTEEKER